MSETDFSRLVGTIGGQAPTPAIPQFFTEPVHMTFLSNEAGRAIYEDQERVRIIIPGDRRNIVVEPVSEEHKARWPEAYKAFKEGREAPRIGTPLAEWPVITRARVEELAYFNIKTVEELAAVTDTHLQNLGMGARELRQSAQTHLAVAKSGTGPIEKLLADRDRLTLENDRLTRELTAANAENHILKERLHAPAAA